MARGGPIRPLEVILSVFSLLSMSTWLRVECSASMCTAGLAQVETVTLPPKFSTTSRVSDFTATVVSVWTVNIAAVSSTA